MMKWSVYDWTIDLDVLLQYKTYIFFVYWKVIGSKSSYRLVLTANLTSSQANECEFNPGAFPVA